MSVLPRVPLHSGTLLPLLPTLVRFLGRALWVGIAIILATPPLEASGPRLEVRLTPRMANAPVIVTIFARVHNMDESWACPEVIWIMPDGTRSTQEADCEYWEDSETSWSKRARIDVGGTWTFEVQLRKAGRLLAKASAEIKVQ